MKPIRDGQCGLCTHFDEHSKKIPASELVKIRKMHEADDTIIAECGHPIHEKLHLQVTPISGCQGFEEAKDVQH